MSLIDIAFYGRLERIFGSTVSDNLNEIVKALPSPQATLQKSQCRERQKRDL